MSAHVVGHIIEAALCVAPFVGIPLLCWRDPAGHGAAEQRKRDRERAAQ